MKKRIVISSIFILLLALILVLFNVVFCLRSQTVYALDEYIIYTKEEIINATNLKYGQSIFGIDKDKAISNIESTLPYIEVTQIRTISLTNIEIIVKNRFETYFITKQSSYYILDEEMKVLRITHEKPTNLVEIICDDIDLENIDVCDFLSTEYMRSITENAFITAYTTASNINENIGLAHSDFTSIFMSLDMEVDYSLNGQYDRLVLTTREGVVFDICSPDIDLERKMNICFSTMNSGKIDNSTGRIRIYFDTFGELSYGYFNN